MRRKRPDEPDIQLLPRNGRTPAPPIRKVGLRFVKAKGRFVPCAVDDRRATIVADFDAAGRSVQAVYDELSTFDAEPRQIGWQISVGAYSNRYGPGPSAVMEWFDNRKANT